MKRIWLMLVALAFFMVAPVIAQGDAGSAAQDGAVEESAPGMPGDNESDDAVEDPEVVGQDEGEDNASGDTPGMPGDNEGDDAVEDPEVVGQDEGEEGAAAGEVAGGGAAGAQPWTFTAFDLDGDGFLSEAEFRGGFFEFISEDPARISQDRYEGALDTFMLGGMPDFETADANADGFLDAENEFASAFGSDLYQQWDADGDSRLSSQEYVAGMMGTFDANADGTFDQQEFQSNAQWFETEGEQVAGGGGAEGGFGDEFFLGEQVGPGVDATEEQDIGGAGDEEAADDAADEGGNADDAGMNDEGMDDADDAGGADDAEDGANQQ